MAFHEDGAMERWAGGIERIAEGEGLRLQEVVTSEEEVGMGGESERGGLFYG